jgi:hypothetical protein
VKRSRSGTASHDKGPGTSAIVLMIALATVLAFAGSFVFGLKRPGVRDQAAPVVETDEREVPVAHGGRVEVLNGAGKSGLARVATDQLRAAGFDVVQFGNADDIRAKSQVIDRVGKLDAATAIGRTLGISDVKTQIDSTRYVDVSVILGSDWAARRTPAQ